MCGGGGWGGCGGGVCVWWIGGWRDWVGVRFKIYLKKKKE